MREHKGKSLIALPSDYVVIDTETTGLDYEYCSIIEVSAVRCSGGSVVDKFTSLIKPEPVTTYYPCRNDGAGEWVTRYVDQYITDLTGITNEMLAEAPEPSEVMPKLLDFLGDSVLIGHNANFDVNFLYDAAMDTCGKPLTNGFIDTLRIARKVFPDLKHHRLSDVAEACGVTVEGAHRAEADCMTTAGCYEHMKSRILKTETEADFQHRFIKSTDYADGLRNITATVDQIDDTNPIFGKIVVFTGKISTMTRKEAFQIVANLGGIPQDTITKKTNFLVIGSEEFASSVKNGKTQKMQKAEEYMAKGQEIAVLSEAAFFDLVEDWISPSAFELEIYDFILPRLTDVLEFNCVGKDSIKAQPGKRFTSVQYIRPDQIAGKNAAQLVFRIVARKGKFAFEVADGDSYVSIPFDPDDNGIIQHIPMLQNALDVVIDSGSCEYSCCSRVEQCSDSRRCVNPYPYIAANCNYRKILKSGRVFYGKNRTIDG